MDDWSDVLVENMDVSRWGSIVYVDAKVDGEARRYIRRAAEGTYGRPSSERWGWCITMLDVSPLAGALMSVPDAALKREIIDAEWTWRLQQLIEAWEAKEAL